MLDVLKSPNSSPQVLEHWDGGSITVIKWSDVATLEIVVAFYSCFSECMRGGRVRLLEIWETEEVS